MSRFLLYFTGVCGRFTLLALEPHPPSPLKGEWSALYRKQSEMRRHPLEGQLAAQQSPHQERCFISTRVLYPPSETL